MKEKIKKVIERFENSNQQESEIIEVLKRGYTYTADNPERQILVVGINPSYNPMKNDYETIFSLTGADENIRYWKRTKQMLNDHITKTAYLDLFPIKFSKQAEFEQLFQKNLRLMGELLQITQEEIERLAPRLIIVQNKRAQCYWGRSSNSVWMGYRFEKIDSSIVEGKELDVCRIVGLKDDPNNERVFKLTNTSLIGSIVVFYALYDERHQKTLSHRILESKDIAKLYEYAIATAGK